MSNKCYCDKVIGTTEDEDGTFVPVYRYCPPHKNEDRFPFLAKDLHDLDYKGIRLNKRGKEWREALRRSPEHLAKIEKFKKELENTPSGSYQERRADELEKKYGESRATGSRYGRR